MSVNHADRYTNEYVPDDPQNDEEPDEPGTTFIDALNSQSSGHQVILVCEAFSEMSIKKHLLSLALLAEDNYCHFGELVGRSIQDNITDKA